jgi:hypothetical protein
MSLSAEEAVMKLDVGNVDRANRVVIGSGPLSLLYILEGNARRWGLKHCADHACIPAVVSGLHVVR